MYGKLVQYCRLIFSVHSSYRRYAVDSFYQSHIQEWNKNLICIDVGGKRKKKKGVFQLEQYINDPIYVNIDSSVEPNYVCDARKMPFENNYADIVICSELLEHIDGVDDVLAEIYRVLKPGGKAYICVPFSMHIHAAPNDYCRYTDSFWKNHLQMHHFEVLEFTSQGGYWATKLNMNKRFFKCYRRKNKRNPLLPFVFCLCVIARTVWLLLEFLNSMEEVGYTTGYGFVISKH